MKFNTMIINTIEMTYDESNQLWTDRQAGKEALVCGKRLIRWFTNDGENSMHLEGEDFVRQVIILDNETQI